MNIIKKCLEAAQIENKMNHLEKSKIDLEHQKEFIENNKLITQQRFRSKKQTVFAAEINEIALSSNDDKRVQSIGSIETYAHKTRKDLVSKKDEIKCNNVIKKHKIV